MLITFGTHIFLNYFLNQLKQNKILYTLLNDKILSGYCVSFFLCELVL